MKFWLTVLLGMVISWFLIDVSSEGWFRSLFAPLICTFFFFIGLIKLAAKIPPNGTVRGGGGSDSGGGFGGGDGGGDC